MAHRGKKYRNSTADFDSSVTQVLDDGIGLALKNKYANF